MASTPPLQILGSPRTPPTPLHGASYDHEDSPRRTSARLRQKRALEDATEPEPKKTSTRAARTPSSPRTSNLEPRSPDRTPQRKSTCRRVQIMSPTSPDSDTSAPSKLTMSLSMNQPFLSTNTMLNEGMLPTPVKTPNKKHKMINKSNIAARALFQDHLTADSTVSSPRRNRQKKRYNGFSLESFRAETSDGPAGVQIFTDSRDQIPEIDKQKNNPFLDDDRQGASSKKVTGSSKRRKVSESRRMDPQVEEALDNDDGMVYVFRGKKIYRRFDDTGEEEEEIDANDLGLLRYTANGGRIMRPMKTLTRKSIKPTRLFQNEVQKRARELEREEEATTDIEETTHSLETDTTLNEELDFQSAEMNDTSKGKGKSTTDGNDSPITGKKGGKVVSPFDSWARIKRGSSSSSASKPTRSRKRAASPSFESPLSTTA